MTMIDECGAKENATSMVFIAVDSEQATAFTFYDPCVQYVIVKKLWLFKSQEQVLSVLHTQGQLPFSSHTDKKKCHDQ